MRDSLAVDTVAVDRGREVRVIRLCVPITLLLCLAAAHPIAAGDPNRFEGTTGVVEEGDDLEINFSHPGLANKTVTVLVVDDDGHEVAVRIKLDAKGKGKTKIITPAWDFLILEHPTSEDHGIVIL